MKKCIWYLRMAFIALIIIVNTACRSDQVAEDSPIEPPIEADEPSQPEEAEVYISEGEIEDGVYRHQYFKLDIDLPDQWTLLTHEEMDLILNRGKGIIEKQDAQLAVSLDQVQMLNLIGVYRYPLEDLVPINPSMIINAELLQDEAIDMDPITYLQASKSLLQSYGLPYIFEEVIREVEVNNASYAMLRSTLQSGDRRIGQTYLASNVQGYMVNIILTYTEEEGNETLHQSLGLEAFQFPEQ